MFSTNGVLTANSQMSKLSGKVKPKAQHQKKKDLKISVCQKINICLSKYICTYVCYTCYHVYAVSGVRLQVAFAKRPNRQHVVEIFNTFLDPFANAKGRGIYILQRSMGSHR